MHTVTFSSPYKSIFRFKTHEFPPFMVLTGRNGSGKSHLLEALQDGKVRSSIAPNPQNDIKLFTATSIIPTDTGRFDPAHEQSQRSQWFSVMETHRASCFPGLQGFVLDQGVPIEHCSTPRKIASLDEASLRQLLPNPEIAVQIEAAIKGQLQNYASNVYAQSHSQIGDAHWRVSAQKILAKRPESFLVDSQSGFFEDTDYVWGEIDPFQQAFGRIFTNYRELIHANDRVEKYPPPDDPTRRYLPKPEFEKLFGPAPWEFVNQVLEECQLDFRLNAPPLHETASYEPKLRKLSADVEMKFQDLSSGEKVLMSFALCLYNSQENRQSKVFPKILLLDEVDGPLHPSMTVSLLRTIQNVLVRDRGVCVILTTHSPSTVALAPEDSIYSMNPKGPNVEKVSRSVALSILTAGVPTLSVSFDGRRQVLVESRTDAALYDLLYQRYKGNLASERSLIFLEVGRDQSGQEQNGGCDQVIRFVKFLSEGGNQSVLGLIDWDGKREHTTRVHVLSHSVRNGLESLLLDPRLLVAVVCREHLEFAREKCILSAEDTYISLSCWSNERWQVAVHRIQELVLGNTELKTTIYVSYLDGVSLKISKDYLHLDDHALQGLVVEAFGFLKPKNKRAGDLMTHVAATVLADYPDFLPSDLVDTFRKLLTAEL